MAELRRKPTEREVQSCCDFAQMDRQWKETVDATLNDWSGVVAAQRRQIKEQITAAVDSGDTDKLASLEVSTGDGAKLLETAMLRYAQIAGQQMEDEARRQGVKVGDWKIPEDEEAVTAAAGRELIRSVARTTARVLGLGLVQSASRRAMRLIGLGQNGRDVAADVDAHLMDLSQAQPREAISAAMTTAQNEGRAAVLRVAPPATYVSTEILDRNVCGPCRAEDGTEYTNLIDAEAAYPAGGFKNCLGGTRCRGSFVAVWHVGSAATASGAEETMPYEIMEDAKEGCPYAVVKTGTDDVQGCHDTRVDAEEQMRALYAAEEDGDEYLTAAANEAGTEANWEGVLAVEGITTGDGREFAPEALTWADLPIPLRWNKEDSHGGEPHTVAVNVGRIDKVWRDGNKIMGSGVLNLAEPDGKRAYDLIKGQYLRGVSIDADSIGEANVEYVWAEGTADEDDPLSMLFAQPEKVIFHGGRIRAATLVDIPAFSEAYVGLTAGALLTMGAVGSHKTATSDASWDAGANEKRLDSPLTLSQARGAYAWFDSGEVEDGKIPKTACKFLHHEINADGSAGPANLAACSAGIGALHGARGGSTIPAGDRRGVYNHLAAHLRDGGQTPPEFEAEVVVAHGAGWTPPAAWFRDPQLAAPTPITIDSAGRLYGHAARWGECHIGQTGTCVSPPHEDQHSYFLTGEVVCDDGSSAAVGQITVGTSHAPLNMGAMPAAQHYDHTGWAVADVVVGNDHHGIWVAGAVRPNADGMKVHELRAAGQVSGDWRRIGGQLRLVGLLAVNVPGFPVPNMRARVASGQAYALVASGMMPAAPGLSEDERDRIAMQRVMGILSSRVHRTK